MLFRKDLYFLTILVFFIPVFLTTANSQSIGIATLPKDIPKTTVLIEKHEKSLVERYLPLKEIKLPSDVQNIPGTLIDSNLYVRVKIMEDEYKPLGSGVLITYKDILFVVTADHVVPQDGEVYFRIPQKETHESIHRSHKSIMSISELNWVRNKEDDLAIAFFGYQNSDDIKAINIEDFRANYDDVSIGDDVFVLGYPSSVIFAQDPKIHFVRNGIVSSKLPNGRIIIDSFLFPGNSGGPVFWKPSMGLEVKEPLIGESIPGRFAKLIGIVLQTLSYREEAISTQTGRSRITFEDNSGLSIIISASKIFDLLQNKEVLDVVKKLKKGH